MRAAVFLLFCLVSASPQAAATACGGAEASVLERVEELARAFRAADADALGSMIDPDYVHTNGGSGSTIDRAAWLSWIRSRRGEIDRDEIRLTRYENSDLVARVHGGLAVVTGMNVTAGTRDGAPFESRLRFTQVWVCRDGTWLRTAFHDSRVNP